MEPTRFVHFIDCLLDGLRADARVVGVIGLGSTALDGRRPDRWSDHDLWVVVEDGTEEEFRDDPSWLPESERIVLWFQETPHGMKAVYDDGHLVEVAVFRIDELHVARANTYRVFLDRERLEDRMKDIREATIAVARRGPDRPGYLAGQFLTNVLVGVSRHARGEHLSAHDFVKAQAIGHLLALVVDAVPAEVPAELDDLDQWRRFEEAYPAIAARLERALLVPLPEAAMLLLDVAETQVRPRMQDYPAKAAQVISGTVREILAAGEWDDARISPLLPGREGDLR